VKEKGTDDELRAVAGLCGRLPLALRVAGDFLRLHDNWPVSRYYEALNDAAQRLDRLGRRIGQRDVEPVLALSAADLVKSNPELAAKWQMLSVFPSSFDSAGAAFVWDLKTTEEFNARNAEDELTKLMDRSLVL
jgi:hypothetical protein